MLWVLTKCVLVAISGTEVTPLPFPACSHSRRSSKPSALTGTVALKGVLTGFGAQFPDKSVSADVVGKNSLSIHRCVHSLAQYPSTSTNSAM